MMDDILDEFAPEQEHIVIPKVVYLFLIAFTVMTTVNCLYALVDPTWIDLLDMASKWVILGCNLYAWRMKAFYLRGPDPYFNIAHLLLTIGFILPVVISFLGLYFSVVYFLIDSLFWLSSLFIAIRFYFVYKDQPFNSSPVAFALYSFYVLHEFGIVCLILDMDFGAALFWAASFIFSISTIINLILLNQRGKQEAFTEWLPLIIFLNCWAWGNTLRMDQELIGSLIALGGVLGIVLTIYRQNKIGAIQTF